MDREKKVSAVLLAGGTGNRFHGKKQFVELGGMQMWEHPYKKICDLIGKDRVVIVGINVPGGETRTGSVINGMEALDPDTDRVILVEAARPMVTTEQLWTLIEDDSPSTTFVRPLVNTVVFRSGTYLNRNELYELLTPQAFDYRMLLEALRSGRFTDMTDETRTMFEYFGVAPKFIETTGNLFKVTYPEDIYTAQCLINQQEDNKS